MRANLTAPEEDRLPDAELLAQMSTFMFAAHDTTSTALARALHTLAQHPEAQARLRDEVRAAGVGVLSGVNGGGSEEGSEGIAYDALVALPFLDAVCKETLRLHPPINFMARTCVPSSSHPSC